MLKSYDEKLHVFPYQPIPVAVRSKGMISGRWFVEVLGSNPTGDKKSKFRKIQTNKQEGVKCNWSTTEWTWSCAVVVFRRESVCNCVFE